MIFNVKGAFNKVILKNIEKEVILIILMYLYFNLLNLFFKKLKI